MKSRLLALIAAVTLGVPSASAQSGPSWLRYPAISPDGKTIVFTYKGDLYRVAAAGGTATPLTAHTAHDFMPVWSHDGRQIAFASDRYGNFDVFVMPADGGEATRLTFHSAAEYPYSFTGDDKGWCSAPRGWTPPPTARFPTGSQPELYQVPAAGGRPVQLLTTPAEDVKFSRSGQLMLYHDKKGGENPWRKHHTSAIARDVWIYDTKAGTHRKITDLRRRGPQPRLHRRRQGLLLPERGIGVVQRPQDGHRGRQVAAGDVVQEAAGPLPQPLRRRHALLRLRRRPLHDEAGRRPAEGRRHRRRRHQGQPGAGRAGHQRRAGDGRGAERQGNRVRRPRRRVRDERRGRRHQAHHHDAGGRAGRGILARRQGPGVRLGARRPLGHLRSPKGARRGAALLRVHPRQGIAARRERAAEHPAALLARRQGAGVRRGPQHAEDPEPRVEAVAHAADRQGDLRRRARATISSGAPTASGSCSTTRFPASPRARWGSSAPTARGRRPT